MPASFNKMILSTLENLGFTKVSSNDISFDQVISGVSYIDCEQMCEFLKGGELAVVTGNSFSSPSDFLCLMRLLHQHSCAGVLVLLGVFIQEIPEDIILYCNDSEMPLFTTSKERFSFAQMEQLVHAIHQIKNKNANLSNAIRQAILYPDSIEKYLPVFQNNGILPESSFCIGTVEVFKYHPNTKQKTYLKIKETEIESFLENEYENVVHTYVNNQFVFFFPDCEDYVARDIIMDIYHLIRSNHIDEYIYLGTSECLSGLTNIHRAYRQSNFVSTLKKKDALKTPVIRFSSLTSYRLLASIEDESVLVNYYKQHLAPLLEYDSIHESDYFHVLEVLIRNDFNVVETSNALFLHRNSVNYKINKIENILHCSINTVAGKTVLIEAYKIWCILYKEECLPDRRRRNPSVTFVSSAHGDARDEISLVAENCS